MLLTANLQKLPPVCLLLLPAHLPKPHLKDNPVLRVSLLCIAGTGFSFFFFFLLFAVIASQLIKGFASPYKPCLALTALIATDIQNSLANFGAQQRSGAQKQCTQDCRAMPFRGTVHKTDFHQQEDRLTGWTPCSAPLQPHVYSAVPQSVLPKHTVLPHHILDTPCCPIRSFWSH